MEKTKVKINFGEEWVSVDMEQKFAVPRKEVDVYLQVAVLDDKQKGWRIW